MDLNFDPALPDLPRLFDLPSVGVWFEQQWQLEGCPCRIRSSKLQDVKYQPGRSCVATYVLQLENSRQSDPISQTIGVAEVTPDGVTHRLYVDDPALPMLHEATDVTHMAPRFAALLYGVVTECTITPVRYRAGARCVLRYDIQTHTGHTVLFGKLLKKGADELVATVDALHLASKTYQSMPRVLPPLAFWPELHMVVQAEITGRTELNDLAFNPEININTRELWLLDAGIRLAGLHKLANIAGPPRTITDDIAELHEYVLPIEAVDHTLATRYRAALERIETRSRRHVEPAPVSGHGAFRTDQFMIEGDHLVMIDLDGFCRSNPARDLGNFLAYLRWKAIRQPHNAAMFTRAGTLLLEGYQCAGGRVDSDWLAIYQADSLLKIAGRRYRSLTFKEWPLVPHLLEAAEEILG